MLFFAEYANGAGPALVNKEGVPFAYNAGAPASYITDQGPLGSLTNEDAVKLTNDLADVWQRVDTASITFANVGQIQIDITGENVLDFVNNITLNDPGFVIFDNDGSVISALFGIGASANVIGNAGPWLMSAGSVIHNSRVIMNGLFIDGIDDDITFPEYKNAFVHEMGHFINLDHSQVNLDAFMSKEVNRGKAPVMFPIVSGTTALVNEELTFDDIASVSGLYPNQQFKDSTGAIQGRVLLSDGRTQIQGINVVARNINNPKTQAVSCVSGFLHTGRREGSEFGSDDNQLIGFYKIQGLPPGPYVVLIEPLSFTDIGPLGSHAELPGPPEFYNNPDSNNDILECAAVLNIAAGQTTDNIDFIINRDDEIQNIINEAEPDNLTSAPHIVKNFPVKIAGDISIGDKGEVFNKDSDIEDMFEIDIFGFRKYVSAVLRPENNNSDLDLFLWKKDLKVFNFIAASAWLNTGVESIGPVQLPPGEYLIGVDMPDAAKNTPTGYTLDIVMPCMDTIDSLLPKPKNISVSPDSGLQLNTLFKIQSKEVAGFSSINKWMQPPDGRVFPFGRLNTTVDENDIFTWGFIPGCQNETGANRFWLSDNLTGEASNQVNIEISGNPACLAAGQPLPFDLLTPAASFISSGLLNLGDLETWNGKPLTNDNQPTDKERLLEAVINLYIDLNNSNVLYIQITDVLTTPGVSWAGTVFDGMTLTGIRLNLKNINDANTIDGLIKFAGKFANPGQRILFDGAGEPLLETPGYMLEFFKDDISIQTIEDANYGFAEFESIFGNQTRISGGGVFELTFKDTVDLRNEIAWNKTRVTTEYGMGAQLFAANLLDALTITPEATSTPVPTPTPEPVINPPKADFLAHPLTGIAPLSVQFTDKSTNKPDIWFWDFGDKNSSVDQNPEHTYTVAGLYSVRLIVANSGGAGSETRIGFITVSAAPAPTPTPTITPTATPTLTPGPGNTQKAGLRLTLSPESVDSDGNRGNVYHFMVTIDELNGVGASIKNIVIGPFPGGNAPTFSVFAEDKNALLPVGKDIETGVDITTIPIDFIKLLDDCEGGSNGFLTAHDTACGAAFIKFENIITEDYTTSWTVNAIDENGNIASSKASLILKASDNETCLASHLIQNNAEKNSKLRMPEKSMNGVVDKLNLLRLFRDTALTKDLTGLKLITLYYKNSPEVIEILNNNPELKAKAKNILNELINVIENNNTEGRAAIEFARYTVPTWLETEINGLLNEIAAHGSSKLKKAIKSAGALLHEGKLN